MLCRNPCSDNDECLLTRNGWTSSCDSDANCQAGGGERAERVCAIFGRKQVCVQPANPRGTAPDRAPDCDRENVTVELASGGGDFLACGWSVQCDADTRVCVDRCINDRDCDGAYPSCNRDTGECECATDADCGSCDDLELCNGSWGCGASGMCEALPAPDCGGLMKRKRIREGDGASLVSHSVESHEPTGGARPRTPPRCGVWVHHCDDSYYM